MAVNFPAEYYNRFDPAKKYDRHIYRAGKVLQSAELNEVESNSQDRLKRVADALFKDGAVVKDAGISISLPSGATNLDAGVVYARGAMRGLAPKQVTIPVIGTVIVGIYLQESVVTEFDDVALRDPAIGARNYGEPGAARLKVETVWGVAGDGTQGEFYPVYTVVDGEVIGQNPPPGVDAVSLAIASYDRQSTGGYYLSSGVVLTRQPDEGGNEVFSVSEGVCRVDGREVRLQHARRVVYPAVADLKQVLGEPSTATGAAGETVAVRHGPIASIDTLLIRSRKVLSGFTRGPASGTVDTLPDSPILSIVAVNQGGTWNSGTNAFTGGQTFVQNSDYKLTGDSVDWSLAGTSNPTEPAPGSTYTVVYEYTKAITPDSVGENSFTMTGAVAGSTTTVSYKWKRPRWDRLCLAPDGQVVWVQGVANDTLPIKPQVPPGLLFVASVFQGWSSKSYVDNDGVRLVPMNQLERMQGQIDDLFNVVSDHQLRTDIALLDPTTKKGIFVDPFVDDTKRDQGTAQTAASFDSILTLPVSGVTVSLSLLDDVKTLPLNTAGTSVVIQQTLKTGDMKVNPYDSFEPIPGAALLQPSVDFWTQRVTAWASTVTRQFEVRRTNTTGPDWGLLTRFIGSSSAVTVENAVEIASETTRDAQFLRTIPIAFTLTGLGPGEVLQTVKFDGVPVPFTA